MAPTAVRRVLSLATVAVFTCGVARAASFNVTPTAIVLKSPKASGLLTLSNESQSTLRFQLSAFLWDQDGRGQMVLAATEQVIFFPKLLTLARGEERKVRIGTVGPPGTVERTFRLFVEELPSTEPAAATSAVHVRTRIGIPIFVTPVKASAAVATDGLTVDDRTLSFRIENRGTVHFVPDRIGVKGLKADGTTAFSRDFPAWYILAAHSQTFESALTDAECAGVRTLALEVRIGTSVLNDTAARPSNGCSSATSPQP